MTAAGGLLRLLGGSAAPAARGPGSGQEAQGDSFAALLEKARSGEISSGRPVAIARNAKVTLTDEQLERLSVAADRAEAQGATRALVLIDGLALRVDITMREVTESVDLSRPGVLTGIDAVVRMPSPNLGEGGGAPVLPPGAGRAPANVSLLKALSAGDDEERWAGGKGGRGAAQVN
jgi:hypothetical protein